MTIDPTKFAVGDRVTLHEAEIIDAHPAAIWALRIQFPSGAERWVTFADIATHTPVPKPIKVGGWVIVLGYLTPFQVIAIDEGRAWLKNTSGTRIEKPLSGLTPREAPHD